MSWYIVCPLIYRHKHIFLNPLFSDITKAYMVSSYRSLEKRLEVCYRISSNKTKTILLIIMIFKQMHSKAFLFVPSALKNKLRPPVQISLYILRHIKMLLRRDVGEASFRETRWHPHSVALRCGADDGATASKPVSLPTVRYVNDDYKQRRCSAAS